MSLLVPIWIIATYLITSIPFSVIIGRMVAGVNIRKFGDGNPGATNVRRATNSPFWYVVALLTDILKGILPVGIAYHILGWTGFEIIPITIAAAGGHAFSIFLNFKGGKSLATSLGLWIGLLLFEAMLFPFFLVFIYLFVKEDDWAVTVAIGIVLIFLLVRFGFHPVLIPVWVFNTAIVVYKHRNGLNKPPTLRDWVTGNRNGDE